MYVHKRVHVFVASMPHSQHSQMQCPVSGALGRRTQKASGSFWRARAAKADRHRRISDGSAKGLTCRPSRTGTSDFGDDGDDFDDLIAQRK
jgi:transposase